MNLRENVRTDAGSMSTGVKILVVVFGLVGILMLVGGGVSLYGTIHAQRNYQPVTAEIIGFSSGGYPYVSYYVDGQEYERELNFSSSSMKNGDRLELLYDPADPYKIKPAGTMAFFLCSLFEFMGIVFIAVSYFVSRLSRRT